MSQCFDKDRNCNIDYWPDEYEEYLIEHQLQVVFDVVYSHSGHILD